MQWAKQKGLEGAYAKQRKQAMPRYYWWAQELIFQRVKGALGLDRCRFMVTGAAPLSRHTQEFFMSLGMEIMEPVVILQRTFSRLGRPAAFHSHGLDFHSRALLCRSI